MIGMYSTDLGEWRQMRALVQIPTTFHCFSDHHTLCYQPDELCSHCVEAVQLHVQA
uniref:Uncharacterized protein n=1 Tax=Anguilla anguilla TaxID=7936 RepID=A0A0E9SGV3_ANGAN